ncbi:MAG: hypothetical protein RLZZ458_3340, partial [Planctomycetota bacterium]
DVIDWAGVCGGDAECGGAGMLVQANGAEGVIV